MPCDIANTLQDSCKTVFGLKFFNSIFSSTLWTAFLITLIIILLLMIFIPVKCDTPTWVLFKFMFYTFLSVIGVLFLHNGTLSIHENEKIAGGVSSELLDKMEGKSEDVVNTGVEVKPEVISLPGDDPVFARYGL